jgi:hypothetical protein
MDRHVLVLEDIYIIIYGGIPVLCFTNEIHTDNYSFLWQLKCFCPRGFYIADQKRKRCGVLLCRHLLAMPIKQ